MSIGVLALFFVLSNNFLILFRFVDRDMAIRYHWGHGVGHTYAFGSATNITEAPQVRAEIEEEETDFDGQEVGLPENDEDGLDGCPLGEDDMVYPNNSDDSMSEGDADDGACS